MPSSLVSTPADVIAAAAALLGFAPTDSMVVYLLRRDARHGLLVRCAIRADITITAEQATRFPDTCNLRHPDNAAAILLAICQQTHDAHARTVLDALRDALGRSGIHVLARLHARDVTSAGRWCDLDTGQSGPTYPYTDAVLTARQVHRGERISPSRADIEAEFAPIAPPAPAQSDQRPVATVGEEIAAILAGRRDPDPTLAARAGALITGQRRLRDAMLGLAAGHPRAAVDLWTHVARQLDGAPRAEALTVVACCHCLLGDAVRAGIAADAALQEAERAATPAPPLAGLLLAALQAGIPPARVRAVILEALPD